MIFALLAIGGFSLFLLRSAFFGIATPDESFYLTIPYRLINGDSLIVDEWHASQFSALLLYLPMKIFLAVTKSTDGIILFFRILFVICQILVSIYTFLKLKKYNVFAALGSAVFYLLYVPETVNMLDYYTMSLMGFQVIALTLFCSDNVGTLKSLFVGIVFGCVVLAQPFNIFVYFIYSMAALIFVLVKKKRKVSDFSEKYLNAKTWFLITVGGICVAVVSLIFIFSRITISDFVANLFNVFGGHDHTLPFVEQTGESDMFSYSEIFARLKDLFPKGFIISVIFFALLLIDKYRVQRRLLWLTLGLAVIIVLLVEFFISLKATLIGILFIPFILFVATFICLMLVSKKDKNLVMIFCSGIVYVLFLGMISQALDYVGVIGLVVSNSILTPSFMQLYKEIKNEEATTKEEKNGKTAVKVVLCILLCSVCFSNIFVGTGIKLSDDSTAQAMGRKISALPNVTVSTGPFKGIKVKQDIAESYEDFLTDIETIKGKSCEKVLVAGLVPWIYFSFNDVPATFTSWYILAELDLYESYYKNNPDNIPNCIYIPQESFYGKIGQFSEGTETFFMDMFSGEKTEGKMGSIIYIDGIK
jgi:hypothetical protein